MTPIDHNIKAALAPAGVLRAAINVGNSILAYLDADGNAKGVSVDLAHALAENLEVPIELQVFKTARESVEAVTNEAADVGFFAVDPERGAGIAFSAPYIIIEGCYMVRDDSPIATADEVDRDSMLVVVGKGSAYDLFLSRSLSQARILRAPSSPAVVDVFLSQRADVAAGVKQQLEADAARHGGLRLLPERFMEIRQAMGVPKKRPPEAAVALRAFVDEAKAEGFVAEALLRHGVTGVSVAP